MTFIPMPPQRVNELARAYADGTAESRRALYAEWLQRYGDDMAYDLFVTGLSFIAYPEDPAEFRANWTRITNSDADLREAVSRLSDAQLAGVSASLRAVYLRPGSDVFEVWTLAKQMAGVA